METKYEMPALTDEQRQALIARCKDRINFFKTSGNTGTFDAVTLEIVEIALAALTAAPVFQLELGRAWDDTSKSHCDGLAKHGFKTREVYTVPPVPALKLPERPTFAEVSMRCAQDQDAGSVLAGAWMMLDEVKRLNGVTK